MSNWVYFVVLPALYAAFECCVIALEFPNKKTKKGKTRSWSERWALLGEKKRWNIIRAVLALVVAGVSALDFAGVIDIYGLD